MASFPIRALALGLTLTVASAQLGVAQTAPEPPPRSGVAMPQWARPDPIVTEGVIEDEAVQAVKDMSNYLMSLNTIGITSIGSLDVVTNDGQRIQLDGTTTYKVRKPGFVIDYRKRPKEPAVHLRRQEFHGLLAVAWLLCPGAGAWHKSRSAGHHLQQVRHSAAAGGPVPLGRWHQCGSHPGAQVRL